MSPLAATNGVGGDVASLEASETAAALAEIAVTLPEEAARMLLRQLQSDLAQRSQPLVRTRNLGLLAQMVDATSEVPLGEEYDELRARRSALGESWPDRTTLAETYGGWLRAVRAAMRLWLEDGAPIRPPASSRNDSTSHWSRSGVVDSLIAFYERWGEWPYAHQFYVWGVLERRLARYHGEPSPRIPNRKPIERLWPEDGFDGALDEAKRRYASRGWGDGDGRRRPPEAARLERDPHRPPEPARR